MNLLLLPQKEKKFPFQERQSERNEEEPFFKCLYHIQDVLGGGLMDVGLCLQSKCSNIFFAWNLSFVTLELKVPPMTHCQNL